MRKRHGASKLKPNNLRSDTQTRAALDLRAFDNLCRFVKYISCENMTAQRDTSVRAVSWKFLMRKILRAAQWQVPFRGILYVEIVFFTKRQMRLKLCCVKVWHYFHKVCTWKSRVDGFLSMLNSFELNLQQVANSSWKKKIFIRVLLEKWFRASAVARATSWNHCGWVVVCACVGVCVCVCVRGTPTWY